MSDTKSIRPGEELDEENLVEFLRGELNLSAGEIEISQFPAGNSNLTYCVRVGAQEYVLRRPPFGNEVKSAHDMRREYNVLSKLSVVYPPAPRPLLYTDDESVIGAEFYLMERRRGTIFRGRATPELENSTALQRRVLASFVENLAALHALDYKAAGLGDLGRPEGYVRRQTEGWTKRYFNAKTDEHAEIEAVIDWLDRNVPETNGAPALVHNDYKFDNVMLAPDDLTRIVAVLDWEMTTIGEPLMDFGTTLAYWMPADAPEEMLRLPANPAVLMKNFTHRELAEIYAEKSGRDLTNLLFYYVFGTFKVAVIVQQIYARYRKGSTRDERFARFDFFVAALGRIAARALEKGAI